MEAATSEKRIPLEDGLGRIKGKLRVGVACNSWRKKSSVEVHFYNIIPEFPELMKYSNVCIRRQTGLPVASELSVLLSQYRLSRSNRPWAWSCSPSFSSGFVRAVCSWNSWPLEIRVRDTDGKRVVPDTDVSLSKTERSRQDW